MKSLFSIARVAALLAVVLIAAPQIASAASAQDEAIVKAVQDKLMEGKNKFDATSIIVTSEDGIVNLRGQVRFPKEITDMKNVAETVPGVKRVETQIDAAEQQSQ